MAGIYIKGMEMPTNKDGVAVIIYPDGNAVVEPFDIGFSQYCEAIPVPDHGRLGDLDKLEGEMRLLAKHQTGYRQQGILGCCETVRSAPAVIPADRKEEDA